MAPSSTKRRGAPREVIEILDSDEELLPPIAKRSKSSKPAIKHQSQLPFLPSVATSKKERPGALRDVSESLDSDDEHVLPSIDKVLASSKSALKSEPTSEPKPKPAPMSTLLKPFKTPSMTSQAAVAEPIIKRPEALRKVVLDSDDEENLPIKAELPVSSTRTYEGSRSILQPIPVNIPSRPLVRETSSQTTFNEQSEQPLALLSSIKVPASKSTATPTSTHHIFSVTRASNSISLEGYRQALTLQAKKMLASYSSVIRAHHPERVVTEEWVIIELSAVIAIDESWHATILKLRDALNATPQGASFSLVSTSAEGFNTNCTSLLRFFRPYLQKFVDFELVILTRSKSWDIFSIGNVCAAIAYALEQPPLPFNHGDHEAQLLSDMNFSAVRRFHISQAQLDLRQKVKFRNSYEVPDNLLDPQSTQGVPLEIISDPLFPRQTRLVKLAPVIRSDGLVCVLPHCKCQGKTFKSFAALAKHLQTTFSREPYRSQGCPWCDKSFKHVRSDNIKNHFEQHLPGDFQCPHCPMNFFSNSKLQRHLPSHVSLFDRARRHKCDECDETFIDVGHLRTHKLIHQEDREMWTCPACAKEMYLESKWGHDQTCPGRDVKQVWVCTACDPQTVFGNPGSLAGHRKKWHRNLKEVVEFAVKMGNA